MNRADKVEAAFKACGIGGRFSKFSLQRDGTRVKMIDQGKPSLNRWNYRLLDQFNASNYTEVNSVMAERMVKDDSVWVSHFNTAQKIIAHMVRVVDRPVLPSDNRYFVDRKSDSIFVVNHGYSIGIVPAVN